MTQPGVNSNSTDGRDRQIEAALFFIPFFSYAYFYQGSDQSVACRFDLMRSMLEKRVLWIDGFCGFNTADIVTFQGHIYSVKAPGTSLTSLVQWVFFNLLLMPLYTTHESVYWALTTYLTTIFTTGLLISILCVVMYRFARFLGVSEGRATGVALVLGFATICFPYATELTGEPVAAASAFIAFYLLATFSTRPSSWWAFAAGFLAGWAVLNDYPVFLVAAAIGIYALVRLPGWKHLAAFSTGALLLVAAAIKIYALVRLPGWHLAAFSAQGALILVAAAIGLYALVRLPKWKYLAAFSVGALITGAILLGYNWVAFGKPLYFSYQALSLPENHQFPEQAVGFVGLTYPKARILWNVLFDPQRGLFFCNPVLLLSILGVGYFARLRRWRAEFAVTVYSFVVLILFNASYGESIVSWGGGTATGPRQIVASVPFMVLALAFLPEAYNFILGAMGAISAAIMLMATSTNPHFPYEYDNPVRDFALQQFMRGDFATNRDTFFGGGVIVKDSVAFNLGEIVGLRGPMQLWPLALFWIFGVFDLSDTLEIWGRGAARRHTQAAVAVGISAVFLLSMSETIAQPFELSGHHGLLGHYYVGDGCGESRPHIVRVDRQLDFEDIAHMGAMPFPSCDVWTGELIAPIAGTYEFTMEVDDSGWVTIDGTPVIHDPGAVNKSRDAGRIELSAGRHRIEVGERNTGGGSYLHLFWKTPGASDNEIVPSDALVPDRAGHW